MPKDLPNPHLPALPSRVLITWALLLVGLLSAFGVAAPASAQTLKAVRDRGTLTCGVNRGLLGFSSVDDKGKWVGFDVDLCRAIAAAIFDDASK